MARSTVAAPSELPPVPGCRELRGPRERTDAPEEKVDTRVRRRSHVLEWVTAAATEAIRQYGFLAVFVYMTLETAFLLHFAPSEVVVPFAASQLVHGPASFGLFVLDATAGATVGSLVAYFLLGINGERVLARYGRYVNVGEEDVERSQRWFRRYGESSVAWGRLLPFVRAFISIPAGISRMPLSRFVAYSAGGAFVFNAGLTYLVYQGANERSPIGWLVDAALTHPALVVLLAVVCCAGAAVFLHRTEWFGVRRIG